LVETASRLVEEKKELTKSVRAFRQQALQKQAAEWVSSAEEYEGFRLIVRVVPEVGPAELRSVAVSFVAEPERVALLGAKADGRAHLVFGRSPDVERLDMATLLRQTVSKVEGRGGGSPQLAQGGGPRMDGLEEALEKARKAVRELSGQ
jgi:alanyl-tRNA synthetase